MTGKKRQNDRQKATNWRSKATGTQVECNPIEKQKNMFYTMIINCLIKQ